MMRNSLFLGHLAAAMMMAAIPGTAFAQDDDCAVLDVPNPYLNAQFCARLKALTDSRAVPPTRSVTPLDPETQKLVSEIGLFQEAYEVDPKKALDLIKRIRDAGGLKN